MFCEGRQSLRVVGRDARLPVTLVVVAGRSLAAGPAVVGMMSCPCLSNDPGGYCHRPSRGELVTADKGERPAAAGEV